MIELIRSLGVGKVELSDKNIAFQAKYLAKSIAPFEACLSKEIFQICLVASYYITPDKIQKKHTLEFRGKEPYESEVLIEENEFGEPVSFEVYKDVCIGTLLSGTPKELIEGLERVAQQG